jgi:hypothetical protein
MLLFLIFIFLINVDMYAMSKPSSAIDYSEQSVYDKKFIELARGESSLDASAVIQEFQPLFIDALALCELNVAKKPEDFSVTALESAKLLHYAYEHKGNDGMLQHDEFLKNFLRYAGLNFSVDGCRQANWRQLDMLLLTENQKDSSQQAELSDHYHELSGAALHGMDNEKTYLLQLKDALKNINSTEASLLATRMLTGIDGYKKRQLGAIALVAMLQHSQPECFEPYYTLGCLTCNPKEGAVLSQSLAFAYNSFEEGLKRSPRDARILNRLGVAHFSGWAPEGENRKKAEELWRAALDYATDSGDIENMKSARNNLGYLGLSKKSKKCILM